MSVLTKAQMEAVYQRNCDMIYRICLMHLKHEQDALDAVSETFLRLFQKNPAFTDPEHEKAWLIRTAINYCKDEQKSFWKRKRNIYDETTEQMLQSMQVSEEDTELLQIETVTPKLVLVTMTIKNISYEDDDDMLPIANPLTYIKESGNHTEFDWREFERGVQNTYYRDSMPIWISDSEGGSWFYAKKMKKGDSVTLQLGYLVDEDMLDEMVMEFNFGDGLHDGVWNFIDMRSAAE